MTTDWSDLRRRESAKPYWARLQEFVDTERANGPVYPPAEEVFAALDLTPYDQVKVVLLGQDPYHGPGEAHGLAFSVRGPKLPSSLRNIFTELEDDGYPRPNHGSLEHWAAQGVLLLNTVLTVGGERRALSHARQGWEEFTDAVLRMVDAKPDPVVFMLWGKKAQAKQSLLSDRHPVITAAHPSFFSARKGFFGSKPFSRANDALRKLGHEPIDWRIPDR